MKTLKIKMKLKMLHILYVLLFFSELFGSVFDQQDMWLVFEIVW